MIAAVQWEKKICDKKNVYFIRVKKKQKLLVAFVSLIFAFLNAAVEWLILNIIRS